MNREAKEDDAPRCSVREFARKARPSPARAYYARVTLRRALADWENSAQGFPSLHGARIRPFAHQVHAALRVLTDRRQRFVLADEVGLGKTIEAGLVLQALWHVRPELRALIVTPGGMVQQWFRELYLRFGARVLGCIDATSDAKARRAGLRGRRSLVVSTTALLSDERLVKALTEESWDALIIDEAHHLQFEHALYQPLRGISAKAEQVLLLSATPSKRQMTGLAALLGLLAPDEFDQEDEVGLQAKIDARDSVWAEIGQVEKLLAVANEDGELDQETISAMVDLWGDSLTQDPQIQEWLEDARKEPVQEALEILHQALEYARERWCIDHRIVRTRRRTLAFLEEQFAPRALEATLSYAACAGELQFVQLLDRLPRPHDGEQEAWCSILQRAATTTPRVLDSLLAERQHVLANSAFDSASGFAAAWNSEPGPAEEAHLFKVAPRRCPPLPAPGEREDRLAELDWLSRARSAVAMWQDEQGITARHREAIDWIDQRLAEEELRKVLVFTQHAEAVAEFAEHLRIETGREVALLHHRLSVDEMDAAADSFVRGAAQVLVSDELGGEGRNFQIAWAIVHLDLPVSPARVEQRIGRADRIGREVSRPVLSVVMFGGSTAERFSLRVHRDVFRVFAESIGGLELLMPAVDADLRRAQALGCGADDPLLAALQERIDSAREEADDSFQRALDSSRASLQRSAEIAEVLAERHTDPLACTGWLRALGVNLHSSDRNRFEVDVPGDLELPGGPYSSFHGTWRREDALENERYQFLGPGHRLVDACIAQLDTLDLGRVTAFSRPSLGAGDTPLLVVATFVPELPNDADLPAGIATRVRARLRRVPAEVSLRYDPRERRWLREVRAEVRTRLAKGFHEKNGDQGWPGDQFTAFLELEDELAALDEALAHELARLVSDWRESGSCAAVVLRNLWRKENAYFEALRHTTPSQRELAEAELKVRERALESVRNVMPRLEALAIVRPT